MILFPIEKNKLSLLKNAILLLGVVVLFACNSGPKMIEAESDETAASSTPATETTQATHKVVADEVLQTSKYTYLNVSEDGVQTWIAVPKTEAVVGETYYYRGGLKKTNFKSVEHNRVFETVYLVSGISTSPTAMGAPAGHMHAGMNTNPVSTDPNVKIEPVDGGITIAELFENRSKYDGKSVRIKGRCVKLNNMIMDRNWVHLQDGSLDDPEQNLTITTTENIPLGAVVSVEGVISLNKDFGAGYRYDIIMEEAHLLQ